MLRHKGRSEQDVFKKTEIETEMQLKGVGVREKRYPELSRSQVLVAYEFRLYPGDCGNHRECEGMM